MDGAAPARDCRPHDGDAVDPRRLRGVVLPPGRAGASEDGVELGYRPTLVAVAYKPSEGCNYRSSDTHGVDVNGGAIASDGDIEPSPHADLVKNIVNAQRFHAFLLLREKSIEHAPRVDGTFGAEEGNRAMFGETFGFLAHFFTRLAIASFAQQRVEVLEEPATRSRRGRLLVWQQSQRIGDALPVRWLVAEQQRVAGVARIAKGHVEIGLRDGDVPAQDREVEIRVLAAHEFRDPHSANRSYAKRQKEQRRPGRVECRHYEWIHPVLRAVISMPFGEEVETLVRRHDGAVTFERAPARFRRAKTIKDLNVGNCGLRGSRQVSGGALGGDHGAGVLAC